MPSPFDARAPRPRLDWRAIKDRIDIEAVARALMGEPAGRLAWLCPWHDDHHPSLTVNPDRGTWRCWTCDVGGNAVALVMRLERSTFPEAVRRVAELAGLADEGASLQGPRRQRRPEPAKAPERPPAGPSGLPREEAERVVAEAERALWTPGGAAALDHLRGRGLDDATIRRARLGSVDRLAVPSSGGDRCFHVSGVTLPWFDDDGRLVKLKVRLLPPWRKPDGREVKYVDGFNDSPAIYPSPGAIKPGRPLVMCEGEFDALLLDQVVGDLASVATLGSASGAVPREVRRAIRPASEVYAAHDADDAGDRAAAKLASRAVRVRPPSPAKDWCEAHRLGFNVVRGSWRTFIRDDLPSWKELETWRWGPALDREPPDLGAEPDADDERERIEERRAIAEADGFHAV